MYFAVIKAGEKSQCPACGTEFSIPGTGPSGLPKNMLIERILNMRQLSSGENTRGLCDYCSADEETQETQTAATKYCVQCQEKLCDLCAKMHRKSKLQRGHKLIDVNDTKALEEEETFRSSLPTVCEKHCDQTLTIYCDDCNLAICVTCLHISHKEHATSLIKDITEKFQQQMSSDISRLDDGVGKLREMLISVEQQKEDFIKHVADAEEAIFKKTEEMKQLIEQNKETLINELATRKAEVLQQVTNISQLIALRISLLDNLKKYTKELSTKGAPDYVARESSAVHGRIEELLEYRNVVDSKDSAAFNQRRVYSIFLLKTQI
jgi:hypothetical protein